MRAWLFISAALVCAGCGGEESTQSVASVAAAERDTDRPGGAPLAEPLTTASAPVADEFEALRGVWNDALFDLVERYRGEAARVSGGKVSANDVHVSIHVRDLASGVEFGALNADVDRAPASNMKLVTTAAALVLLGPATEFLTPFEAVGEIDSGVLQGDLVARACGDPIVGQAGDARVESRLDVVAAQLVEAGIRRITGALVLDEGNFQAPAPAPGWPDSSQYWQEHCALAGGFSINGGVLQTRITPSTAGRAARVEVHPSPHGLRSNYDVFSGAKSVLDVRVGATASTVTVKGVLPASRGFYVAEFAHPDPVDLFGVVLLERLRRGGVRVDGGVRRLRDAPRGVRVAELRSSVDATLVPINAESRNSVADQLFLAVGHAIAGSGTRAAGATASRRALEELGVSTRGFVQVDGSGLSRDNRVTARQLTALLAGVLERDERTARPFRDSLAVAGQSGTLEARMKSGAARGRVFAKTGWIKGVSALSGVCLSTAGNELVFSILVDYPPAAQGLNTKVFKPMQDEILEWMVEAAL